LAQVGSLERPKRLVPFIEEASVAELTSLLRKGPGGDQFDGWPDKSVSVFEIVPVRPRC
jgi:hypothetical protein